MAMRRTTKILTLITIAVSVFCTSVSQASFFSLPMVLKYQIERIGVNTKISFGTLMLPPIGHTRFCLQYPGDCAAKPIDFRRRQMALTPERWLELNSINRQVNRDITPEITAGNGTTEKWVISPPAGDCKDYAITKRHELLALGWPSRALLLAEVVVPDGEHHLILVVRTKDVDLVLDNLNTTVRPAAMTYRQYQWVRIETPQNPKFWASVRQPESMQTAMLSD
jgi:predicted transglutaminase-like cysteine proteinase